jgi:hypothetical protein
MSTLNRLEVSTQIYNLEYDILLLNTSPDLPKEIYPLKIAAQLYLWLVIREIPPSSQILITVAQRLQNSLGQEVMEWWLGSWERRAWLLWIFFIGAVVSNGRIERLWFIQELGKLCRLAGVCEIEGSGGLRECLGRVVLQDIFFEFHLRAVWEDIILPWEVDGQLNAGAFVGNFEDEI